MKISLLLLGALLSYGVAGDDQGPSDTLCVDGIRTAVTLFKFSDASSYYVDICAGNLTTLSIWAAAKTYCTPLDIEAGSRSFSVDCLQYAGLELASYAETEGNFTDEYMKNLKIVEYEDIAKVKLWNETIIISKPLWEASKRTISAFNNQYATHTRYGWSAYGFWGGLLLLGMTSRLISFIVESRAGPKTRDIENTTLHHSSVAPRSKLASFLAEKYHWFRANLIIPAAFNSYHQRLFWQCTIPTRIEFVIVLVYYVVSFILCAVSYEVFSPNLYYSYSGQLQRYIADRTGTISYANLPVLWMFSGRNNVFLWATGWSFSTFNIFHRHIARIATIQAIVHSVAYSILQANSFKESWTQEYWFMGGMASHCNHESPAGFLLSIHTPNVLRGLPYHPHLSLCRHNCGHTKIFGKAYDGYLWPLVAIWVLDRLVRIVRQVYCNIHVSRSLHILRTMSTATYSEEADLIRLEVVPGSESLKPKPNQHYYLYQPLKWRGWENHPFTLAGWETIDDGEPIISNTEPPPTTKTSTDDDVSPASASLDTSSNSGSGLTNSAQPQPQARYKFLFYIRPSTGWTKRLRDECIKHPSGPLETRVLLEGPYGETTPLHHFENIILLAGGTGIAGALPYLNEHIARLAQGTTVTHSITLVWAAKQAAMIHDLAVRELATVLKREDVKVTFHATSNRKFGRMGGNVNDTATEVKDDLAVEVRVNYGRPDVRGKVLEVVQEVREAGSQGGRIAVLVCGPAGMADEARGAVHVALKSGVRVEYIEETFGW
ncbi:hypothetical protein V490_00012 [Pseudogymnoascus sp. VKM F-3557]|nr:hypothetical protein V490_00012 [Pseudogymnoascus sp. VKM F-3557]